MDFLKSKKVKGFVLGILALFLADIMGLDPQTVNGIIALASGYLLSQGASDAFGKGKKEVEKKNEAEAKG